MLSIDLLLKEVHRMATTKVPLIEGCIDDDPENEDWIRQNRKLKSKPKGKVEKKTERGRIRNA